MKLKIKPSKALQISLLFCGWHLIRCVILPEILSQEEIVSFIIAWVFIESIGAYTKKRRIFLFKSMYLHEYC